MEYTAKDFFFEILNKVINVSLDDSLSWLKDDAKELINFVNKKSVELNIDESIIDSNQKIEIPDEIYNQFGDRLQKVWDSLAMYVGSVMIIYIANKERGTLNESEMDELMSRFIKTLEALYTEES